MYILVYFIFRSLKPNGMTLFDVQVADLSQQLAVQLIPIPMPQMEHNQTHIRGGGPWLVVVASHLSVLSPEPKCQLEGGTITDSTGADERHNDGVKGRRGIVQHGARPAGSSVNEDGDRVQANVLENAGHGDCLVVT